MIRFLLGSIIALLATFGAHAQTASPDEDAGFYKGKSIRLIVGSGAGDSFDLYGRLISRHLGDHIPGKPTIVVQNMQGAGSLNALNYLMNVAPRDGATLALVIPVSTIQPLLQPAIAKFDARNINWLGSVATDYYTCGFWTKDKLSVSDLQSREFVVGSTAVAGATYAGTRVFANALDLKLRLVSGYGTMNELNHAAEKGEVEGHCGLMATTLKTNLWDQFQKGQLQIVLRASLSEDPALPDIPNAFNLVKSDEDRQVLLLLAGPWYYGRPLAAPPGLAPGRLQTLRDAFEAMVRDPAFLADAKELRALVDPLTAAQVAETIGKIYAIPPEVVTRARPLFGVE
jgi:tripartite-type tricarboxylate transporter receptor subunit TctC